MATLLNQGTLKYTPCCGEQTTVSTNVTATDVVVTYGIDVLHSVTPDTFSVGGVLSYTVLIRNTGTGTLYAPTVTVSEVGGTLSLIPGSVAAFL